jgi:hypothetical protein
MTGGVVVANGAIRRSGDDYTVAHDDRPDGNIAVGHGVTREPEGFSHPTIVCGHALNFTGGAHSRH